MKLSCLAAAAACLLAGNAFAGVVYHTAAKLQVTGLNMNPGTGMSAGYVGGTFDRAPVVDGDGHAITVAGGCKTDVIDTFANLSSKASASASSVGGAAGAIAATASPSGVVAPQIASATGDVTGNGGAALIAAAAMTSHPADVLAAYCGNTQLPAAAPGQIVRDGIAPSAAPSGQ